MEEAWTEAWPWFLEEDLERFMGTAFMGTDREAEVGTLRGEVFWAMQGAVKQWE